MHHPSLTPSRPESRAPAHMHAGVRDRCGIYSSGFQPFIHPSDYPRYKISTGNPQLPKSTQNFYKKHPGIPIPNQPTTNPKNFPKFTKTHTFPNQPSDSLNTPNPKTPNAHPSQPNLFLSTGFSSCPDSPSYFRTSPHLSHRPIHIDSTSSTTVQTQSPLVSFLRYPTGHR